jgi:hypothetical protein
MLVHEQPPPDCPAHAWLRIRDETALDPKEMEED